MYKYFINTFGGKTFIKTNDNGSTTSFNEVADNVDYQEYLEWVAKGNTATLVDNGGNS